MRSEMIPMERRNLTFWNKLYELQYKMLFNNQENVAGHMYASEPLDWLLLKRGVAYWISANSNVSISHKIVWKVMEWFIVPPVVGEVNVHRLSSACFLNILPTMIYR